MEPNPYESPLYSAEHSPHKRGLSATLFRWLAIGFAVWFAGIVAMYVYLYIYYLIWDAPS
jgi:hypothetical protein